MSFLQVCKYVKMDVRPPMITKAQLETMTQVSEYLRRITVNGPRRDKTCLHGSDKARLKSVSSATETS